MGYRIAWTCGGVNCKSGCCRRPPLPLNVHEAIPIDLEETYTRAAKRAYFE